MRKFEDLNKEEKEKLTIYLQHASIISIQGLLTIMLSVIFFIPGTILILTNYVFLNVLGALFVVEAVALLLTEMFSREKAKKKLLLAYGIEDSMRDVFKIEKEDINKVVRKLIKED